MGAESEPRTDGGEVTVIPSRLDDTFRLWFEAAWPAGDAERELLTRLLQVVVAAQEPPTLASLSGLGAASLRLHRCRLPTHALQSRTLSSPLPQRPLQA